MDLKEAAEFLIKLREEAPSIKVSRDCFIGGMESR
jgi:hypothetical protein